MKGQAVLERLAAKTAAPDENGCRLWLGAKSPNGNGVIRVDGKIKQTRRVAYKELVKPYNEDQFVRVTCNNPMCIAPEHMYLSFAPNDNAVNAPHAFRGSEPEDPRITTSNGESKLLSEWLEDPRVTVKRPALKTRYSFWRRQQITADSQDWFENPTTVERVLFTPPRKRKGAWEI